MKGVVFMNKTVIKICFALVFLFSVTFVSSTSSAATTKTYTYYATNNTILYKSTNTKSAKLAYFNLNQKMTTTSKPTAKFYKVTVGSKTGYVDRTKVSKLKTWSYYTNYTFVHLYNSKNKLVQTANVKVGTKLISHQTPQSSKSASAAERVLVYYKGKKYYVYEYQLNAKVAFKSVSAYYKSLKSTGATSSTNGNVVTMNMKNKKDAAFIEKKLKRVGFLAVPSTNKTFHLYTYTKKTSGKTTTFKIYK